MFLLTETALHISLSHALRMPYTNHETRVAPLFDGFLCKGCSETKERFILPPLPSEDSSPCVLIFTFASLSASFA